MTIWLTWLSAPTEKVAYRPFRRCPLPGLVKHPRNIGSDSSARAVNSDLETDFLDLGKAIQATVQGRSQGGFPLPGTLPPRP